MTLPALAASPGRSNGLVDDLYSDKPKVRADALFLLEMGLATGAKPPVDQVLPGLIDLFERPAEEGTSAGASQAKAAQLLRTLGADSPAVAQSLFQAHLTWPDEEPKFVIDALTHASQFFDKPSAKILQSLRKDLLAKPSMKEAQGLVEILSRRDPEFPKYAQKVLDALWKRVEVPEADAAVGHADDWVQFLSAATLLADAGAKSKPAVDAIRKLLTTPGAEAIDNGLYFDSIFRTLLAFDPSSDETKETLRKAEVLSRQSGNGVRELIVAELGAIRTGRRAEVDPATTAARSLDLVIAKAKKPEGEPATIDYLFDPSHIADAVQKVELEDRLLYLRKVVGAMRKSPSPIVRKAALRLVRNLWRNNTPGMRDALSQVKRCARAVRILGEKGKLLQPGQ